MLCWIRQWQLSSSLDDSSELSPALRAHVARCERCRSVYEQEILAATALAASEHPYGVPSLLPERTRAAVRSGVTEVDTRRTPRTLMAWTVATAAVLALVVALLFALEQRHQSEIHRQMAAKRLQVESTRLIHHTVSARTQLHQPLHALIVLPMSQELSALSQDAERASSFVLDCVPFSAKADTER